VKEPDRELLVAAAVARAARTRLSATIGAIQRRVTPSALVDEALREVRERSAAVAGETVSLAKRHPIEAVTAAAVVTGVIARKPIWQAVSRLFSRDKKETSSPSTSSSRN
jgi:hypothetical protein